VEECIELSGRELRADVVLHEGEVRLTLEVGEGCEAPAREIVDGNDLVPVHEEAITQMRAEKARSSDDHDASLRPRSHA
jgi:hypothetical protein